MLHTILKCDKNEPGTQYIYIADVAINIRIYGNNYLMCHLAKMYCQSIFNINEDEDVLAMLNTQSCSKSWNLWRRAALRTTWVLHM